jgi:hypothetical protein
MGAQRAAVLILIVLVAACGAAPPVDEKTASEKPGYARVFGTVRYIEDGKEARWDSVFPSTDSLTLFVRPAAGGEMLYVDVPADALFFWPLQAGEYTIVGFQLARRSAATFTRTLRVMARFSVAQAGQALYIGELAVETRGGAIRMQVVDRYESALPRVTERIQAAKASPAKSLMKLEPPPGRFARQSSICGPSWAVGCDSDYQGVRPVKPEGTERTFVLVSDRTPALEWKPSAKPGTTYDVAIYESLDFTYSLWGDVRGLRGSLVAYAEALPEPRYVPPALEPGKRYQWSVRLRESDTVSSWSSTSYSFFLVIAARRASGQYFGFEVP